MNQLPKDPFMLLSVINTNLRDYYDNLEDLCSDKNIELEYISESLEKIGYRYSREKNAFCPK